MCRSLRRRFGRDADARPRSRASGQLLVLFAVSIVVLTGITAIVVDVSWYWANTLRVQRAADAAALAGAVWLPGQPVTAFSTARAEAVKNGYTNGVGSVVITPTQDSVDPRELDVSVSAPVNTFFMRVFGINTITARRTATAIFVQPVPMGSPQAYYGVGCFFLKAGGLPACTNAATSNGASGISSPGGGSLNSQGGWGAIITKGGNEQNGDAYAPANNGGGGGFGGGGNALYDPNGYYYLAVVAQAGGSIYAFDPGFCAMGGNGSGGNYGAGDHWIGGNTNPVSTYYTLYNTNGVPALQSAWTQISSSGALFENQTASDTANGGPATSTGSASMTGCDAFHDSWWLVRSGLAAGTYAVQVQTTNPGGGAINQNTNAENMFSLLVGSGGAPRVYGSGRMATYNNLAGGLQKFYLAQIDQATGAGKTAQIDLFDPGDVGGNAFLKILNPDGGGQTYATFSYTTDGNCGVTATANGKPQSDSCSGTNVTQIQTANAGSSSFNNTWIHITIPLPGTYGSGGLWQGGWWQIEYNVSSGNDTTTWQVSVRGNPVHLIVP